MTVRATFDTKSAYLSSDFGLQLARKYFSEEEIASLGVHGPRSKYAGKPKGMISWDKCTRGGWVSTGPYTDQASGYVERRVGKLVRVRLETQEWRQQPVTVKEVEASVAERQAATDEFLMKEAVRSVWFFIIMFDMVAECLEHGIKTTVKYPAY